MQAGIFADVPVKSILAASAGLQEHLENSSAALLTELRNGKKIEGALETGLKDAFKAWKSGFKA